MLLLRNTAEKCFILSLILTSVCVSFTSTGQMTIRTINLKCHRLTPYEKEHLHFLATLRNQNTPLLFWSGIGGLGDYVDIISSERDLKYYIPATFLNKMDWRILYENVTISRTKRFKDNHRIVPRMFLKKKRKRTRLAKRQIDVERLPVAEILHTNVFTGRFYRLYPYPDRICFIASSEDDKVTCYRNNSSPGKTASSSSRNYWALEKFDNTKFFRIRSKSQPGKFISYNATTESFTIASKTTNEEDSLFKIKFYDIHKFHPICYIQTKSKKNMSLGFGNDDDIDVVAGNPLFPESPFIFYANELFETKFHKAKTLHTSSEEGETIGVMAGQVINRSNSSIDVQFSGAESGFSEQVVTDEQIHEKTFKFGVEVKFLDTLGVNFNYENVKTDVQKNEDIQSKFSEVYNSWKITVPPWSSAKYSSYWTLTKNGTLAVDMQLKVFRREIFLGKSNTVTAIYDTVRGEIPGSVVVKVLRRRNIFSEIQIELQDDVAVFRKQVSVSGVQVMNSSRFVDNITIPSSYEVECIRDVLPNATVSTKPKLKETYLLSEGT